MYVSIIATVAAVAVAAPYVIVRAKLNIGLYSSTKLVMVRTKQ